jgi:hypothetical protein
MATLTFGKYILTSIEVFLIAFFIGTFIDQSFYKIQNIYNLSPLTAAILQLLTIIIIAYPLYILRSSYKFIEQYAPQALFSSFLIGLQPNMINNFKLALKIS